jgi:hypothetical protein
MLFANRPISCTFLWRARALSGLFSVFDDEIYQCEPVCLSRPSKSADCPMFMAGWRARAFRSSMLCQSRSKVLLTVCGTYKDPPVRLSSELSPLSPRSPVALLDPGRPIPKLALGVLDTSTIPSQCTFDESRSSRSRCHKVPLPSTAGPLQPTTGPEYIGRAERAIISRRTSATRSGSHGTPSIA